MMAPLQQPTLVPIYALSGSPHPDTPPMAAGKAAAIEAENARRTPERARAVGFPPAGGASVFSRNLRETRTKSFQFPR